VIPDNFLLQNAFLLYFDHIPYGIIMLDYNPPVYRKTWEEVNNTGILNLYMVFWNRMCVHELQKASCGISPPNRPQVGVECPECPTSQVL
jgi:hypothetical protein